MKRKEAHSAVGGVPGDLLEFHSSDDSKETTAEAAAYTQETCLDKTGRIEKIRTSEKRKRERERRINWYIWVIQDGAAPKFLRHGGRVTGSRERWRRAHQCAQCAAKKGEKNVQY